jgi:hypothetical protein
MKSVVNEEIWVVTYDHTRVGSGEVSMSVKVWKLNHGCTLRPERVRHWFGYETNNCDDNHECAEDTHDNRFYTVGVSNGISGHWLQNFQERDTIVYIPSSPTSPGCPSTASPTFIIETPVMCFSMG